MTKLVRPAIPKAPIALEAYEKLAHGYAARAETKAENGYNEHPAIRAQIGDVSDLMVLDAGCGPGFLVRDMVKAGAKHVTGFDISPTMIEIAKETVKATDADKTALYVSDLAAPISEADNSVDLITSSLALDYVYDWSGPLGEFRRILKPDGRLVFSVQHPLGSYKWLKPPNAFGIHYTEADWKGFTDEPVVVPDYYRSFEEIISPILNTDFHLHTLKETRPVKALQEIDPYRYERGTNFPTFMVIEARLG